MHDLVRSLLGYFRDLLLLVIPLEAVGLELEVFDLAHLTVEQSNLVADLDDARDSLVEALNSLLAHLDALRVLADVPRLASCIEVPVYKWIGHGLLSDCNFLGKPFKCKI